MQSSLSNNGYNLPCLLYDNTLSKALEKSRNSTCELNHLSRELAHLVVRERKRKDRGGTRLPTYVVSSPDPTPSRRWDRIRMLKLHFSISLVVVNSVHRLVGKCYHFCWSRYLPCTVLPKVKVSVASFNFRYWNLCDCGHGFHSVGCTSYY